MKTVLSMLPALAFLPLGFWVGCSTGDASNSNATPTPDPPASPIEVHASHSSFLAISVCQSLGYGTSLGIYTIEDLQPAEGDAGQPVVLATLALQDPLALTPPAHAWSLIPAGAGWDGVGPVRSDIELRAGEDILVAVRVLEEDPNAPRILLNNTTVFPRTEGGWTHAGWSSCGVLSTEEFREIAARRFAPRDATNPGNQACEGDLFVPVPGGQQRCGDAPMPPDGDDPDAE